MVAMRVRRLSRPTFAAGFVIAVTSFATLCFTPATREPRQVSTAAHAIAEQRTADISRKQALVSAAVLASGASAARADGAAARIAELMKEDPTPNDNGAPEKHIPKAYVGGGSVDVLVQHVMDSEKPHYIQYMWLKDAKSDKILASKAFKATDPTPALSVDLPKGTTAIPMLFCNLHGLWQGEQFTMA